MRIVIVCLVICALTGCGGYRDMKLQPAEQPVQTGLAAMGDNNAYADIDRELSYTVDYQLKTLNPDSVHTEMVLLVERYNGYVLEATKTSIEFRLRAEFLNKAIAEIESLGEVTRKEIKGTDFSDKYTDLTRRLENATETRQKYLDLLSEATTSKEIAEIEAELAKLQLVIENYESQLYKLNHLIQYASFTVETTEGVTPGPVGWALSNMFKGVKKLFVW